MSNEERRKSLTEDVQDRLMEMILNGDFASDDCLPSEQTLSEMFKVSRTTTRSAVGALVEKGLLERKHGKGVFVAHNSLNVTTESLRLMMIRENYSVAEFLETRKILEPQNAYYAALRATDSELEQMRMCVDRMKALGRNYDDEFTVQDINFHMAVAYASKNKLLIAFMEAMKPLLVKMIKYVIQTGGQAEADVGIHREVLDAICAHDPILAQEKMLYNMRESESTFMRSFTAGTSINELVIQSPQP